MSTLTALVVLLLVLVGLLVVGGLGYVVHRRPALIGPLTIAIAAAALLVAMVGTVASATG
ncbi:hypothetical protein QFZ75_000008 [Streptomyces sp. V3I8]|uniref:hypothetical protein n=1 Tax=Streptomyces sp. V3I8 TaxID=3042279 RepID=UPI00278949A2|nr:hypothetical protein [Streptomyces sp. V3I8]MDQ1033592.1 hypothetical protein [Streptomyces sp. V3I8]